MSLIARRHNRHTLAPVGINHDEELIFTAGLVTAVSGGTFVPVPEPVNFVASTR
jgi:hypothetical protein